MITFNNSSFGRFKISSFRATLKTVVNTKALMGLARRIKAHKEMQNLQRLDARMLKDIGLYRSDLDWALQQSSHMDPLAALQERRTQSLHAQHLNTVQAYCEASKS